MYNNIKTQSYSVPWEGVQWSNAYLAGIPNINNIYVVAEMLVINECNAIGDEAGYTISIPTVSLWLISPSISSLHNQQ